MSRLVVEFVGRLMSVVFRGPDVLICHQWAWDGYSTRCHAVMEYLADLGCQIHVLTSGNGLDYFRDKRIVRSLTSMESFYYSGKNGGGQRVVHSESISSLARIARSKRAQLAALLDNMHPDVAVIDSEYSIGPLRRRHNIPVVALNTSEMIVTEYLKCRKRVPGIRSHFLVC